MACLDSERALRRTPELQEQDWRPVLNENELPEGQPMRVEVKGAPILLYRHRGVSHAMGAVCGHAAGALEEGTFEDAQVTCPLHQSVYDLRDGSVVHSPSLYPELTYDVRVRGGRIEVKLRKCEEARGSGGLERG